MEAVANSLSPDSPLPSRAWQTVALLWFVACFNYLARVMIMNMHGSVISAIPMTEAQFGLLSSVFLWVYGALSPLAGFMSDRFGRRRVIVTSVLIWSTVTCLTGLAKTFGELITMRALMGVSESCYFPAALALISEYHRGPTRSFATGLHMTGLLIGASVAGLAGWVAEVRSWNFTFFLVGAVGIAYGIFLAFTLRDAPPREPETGQAAADGPIRFGSALASLFASGSFLLVLLFCCMSGAIGYAVIGWMPAYLQEAFHLHQGAAGFSTTGYVNLSDLAGVLVGGILADRWSRTQIRARIYVLAIGYCAAAPGIYLAANPNVFAFVALGMILWGLASGACDSNFMPVLCLTVDRRFRATAYGVTNFFVSVCGGFSVYGAGLLRDRHVDFGHILHVTAFALIICPILLFLIKPRPELVGA